MSVAERSYLGDFPIAEEAGVEVRASFLTKTYLHLAGAIAAFVALEAVLLQLPMARQISEVMTRGINFFLVLIAFVVVSNLAERWAHSATSIRTQYLGLGVFVLAESVIFLPLLYFASVIGQNRGENLIGTAAVMTLVTFAGLTAVVFVTRKDFSFLRGVLLLGSVAALGFIVCGFFFGFALGTFFIGAMIALACGYILYHTSNVLHHYRVGQHVAASVALFASVALLFWYVLQLVMSRE